MTASRGAAPVPELARRLRLGLRRRRLQRRSGEPGLQPGAAARSPSRRLQRARDARRRHRRRRTAHGAGGATGVAPDVTLRRVSRLRLRRLGDGRRDDRRDGAHQGGRHGRPEHVHRRRVQQLGRSPTAEAADALVDAGIVVVASIGNSGANGIYSAGAPGVGDKVIGVASYDNSHVQAPGFTVLRTGQPFRTTTRQQRPGIPDPPNPADLGNRPRSSRRAAAARSGRCPRTRSRRDDLPRTGALPFPAGYFTGTVALIRRGTCTFNVKVAERGGRGRGRRRPLTTTRRGVAPLVTARPADDDSRRGDLEGRR